jgi:hypothetical protein
MRKKCKHEFRFTTNNYGGTDGVCCIHCLEFRKWEDRKELVKVLPDGYKPKKLGFAGWTETGGKEMKNKEDNFGLTNNEMNKIGEGMSKYKEGFVDGTYKQIEITKELLLKKDREFMSFLKSLMKGKDYSVFPSTSIKKIQDKILELSLKREDTTKLKEDIIKLFILKLKIGSFPNRFSGRKVKGG